MRRIVAFFCAFSFASCDAPYGVSHTAMVRSVPSPELVLNIVRSTPGVDSVQYDLDDRNQAPEVVHTFQYEGSGGVQGIIQFVQGKNRVHFLQYWRQLGTPPAQPQIDATLPIMRAIERRLETEAGLTGLQASIQQSCRGVRC